MNFTMFLCQNSHIWTPFSMSHLKFPHIKKKRQLKPLLVFCCAGVCLSASDICWLLDVGRKPKVGVVLAQCCSHPHKRACRQAGVGSVHWSERRGTCCTKPCLHISSHGLLWVPRLSDVLLLNRITCIWLYICFPPKMQHHQKCNKGRDVSWHSKCLRTERKTRISLS